MYWAWLLVCEFSRTLVLVMYQLCLILQVRASVIQEQKVAADNGRPLGYAEEGFRFHPLQAKRDGRCSRHVISRETVTHYLPTSAF